MVDELQHIVQTISRKEHRANEALHRVCNAATRALSFAWLSAHKWWDPLLGLCILAQPHEAMQPQLVIANSVRIVISDKENL